jgi:hypothetical protein
MTGTCVLAWLLSGEGLWTSVAWNFFICRHHRKHRINVTRKTFNKYRMLVVRPIQQRRQQFAVSCLYCLLLGWGWLGDLELVTMVLNMHRVAGAAVAAEFYCWPHTIQ